MRRHRLRSFAWGDLSSNFRGRSGDVSAGAMVDLYEPDGTSTCVQLTVDASGEVRLTARPRFYLDGVPVEKELYKGNVLDLFGEGSR